MYYTTQLLADPNASHVGFYVTLFFLVAFFCVWITVDFEDFIHSSLPNAFVSTVVLSVATYFSFFVPQPTPLNEPVVAKMVGTFEANYNVNSGKKVKTVQGNYVTYRVPEGDVVFLRGPGQVFPETAILYRQQNEK